MFSRNKKKVVFKLLGTSSAITNMVVLTISKMSLFEVAKNMKITLFSLLFLSFGAIREVLT